MHIRTLKRLSLALNAILISHTSSDVTIIIIIDTLDAPTFRAVIELQMNTCELQGTRVLCQGWLDYR